VGFKLSDRLLFNTRSEGVESANFWKKMFAENRCIIPASSYFQWPEVSSPKPKYEVTLPGREFLGIAGVWSPWQNPKTGKWERTFSAFTSEPNVLIKTIHNRQPVILERWEVAEWLSVALRAPSSSADYAGGADVDEDCRTVQSSRITAGRAFRLISRRTVWAFSRVRRGRGCAIESGRAVLISERRSR
jgi:putative SOS response-associated peptidase YedK